ncbi:hypothetical protein BT96DRAFT_994956 [Gymnopus androsaceus JB14]|uniref:Uncharacterized protein n=1 Tax=Gymnopus androsaceus JB14 TaxID=1447944 RepID=A0A6A4HMP5_9AGAR|nr:hypothetical protein BT96DRAFT_994956 [Gymnopus androsaceus JB14]
MSPTYRMHALWIMPLRLVLPIEATCIHSRNMTTSTPSNFILYVPFNQTTIIPAQSNRTDVLISRGVGQIKTALLDTMETAKAALGTDVTMTQNGEAVIKPEQEFGVSQGTWNITTSATPSSESTTSGGASVSVVIGGLSGIFAGALSQLAQKARTKKLRNIRLRRRLDHRPGGGIAVVAD